MKIYVNDNKDIIFRVNHRFVDTVLVVDDVDKLSSDFVVASKKEAES